ncbi:efflux RND transporter periplasmic adaptor subunit [Kitasatospora sp. NPDC101801]|uniref:efflux RND transporter periplasmic adaptor subunit n=1 Tax=Kitasatospora sp. NPDC101801 TaxID=3364103 RepID=UPI003801DA82
MAATGAVGVAVAVFAGLGYDGGGPAPAPKPPAPSTAPVTRATLVDQVRLAGRADFGPAQPLAARSAGTVTALAAPGTVLDRGDAAYRVDDQPVVVLLGALPAYRALADGVSGPDVRQFEENLRALGYGGFKVDTVFDKSTATALKKWQKALGLPESGTLDLGRVVYVAAPVRVAEHKQRVGDAAAPGTAVLTTTGTARSVTVTLEDRQVALVKVGTKVRLQAPGGTPLEGTVTATGPADTADGDTGQKGGGRTRVTVTPADQAGLGGGDAVEVTVVRGEKKDALTVPIVALLAVGDGYGVEVFGPGGRHVVPVQVGMFAQGRAEVSGPGLAEGTRVGVAGQ